MDGTEERRDKESDDQEQSQGPSDEDRETEGLEDEVDEKADESFPGSDAPAW